MNFKKENKRERSTIKTSISAFVNKIVQDSYKIGTSNYASKARESRKKMQNNEGDSNHNQNITGVTEAWMRQ